MAAGAFLALAFAREERWIGSLYAWDLIAAALACLASVALLRTLPGPAVLLCPIVLAALATILLGKTSLTRNVGFVLAPLAVLVLVAVAIGLALSWTLSRAGAGAEPAAARPDPALLC